MWLRELWLLMYALIHDDHLGIAASMLHLKTLRPSSLDAMLCLFSTLEMFCFSCLALQLNTYMYMNCVLAAECWVTV